MQGIYVCTFVKYHPGHFIVIKRTYELMSLKQISLIRHDRNANSFRQVKKLQSFQDEQIFKAELNFNLHRKTRT